MKESQLLEGYLCKDSRRNKVSIRKTPLSDVDLPIKTAYTPVVFANGVTLLKVKLITGRSHQIRAHLASIGHPVIGDPKYGERQTNQYYEKKYQIRSQLLHSYELYLPEISGELSYLSGRHFTAPLPDTFIRLMKGEQLEWQHGIPEA